MEMILWPRSRQSILTLTAREISVIARDIGATPVAKFVDEDVDSILCVCEKCCVGPGQLHGPAIDWRGHPNLLNILYPRHEQMFMMLMLKQLSAMQQL